MAGIELDSGTTDPEALAKMFSDLEAGGGETSTETKTEEPKPEAATPDPKTEPEAGKPEPQKAEQSQAETNDDPAGVATKDGKHVIPYSVLKGERDRAARAEATLAGMQEQIANLEKQVKEGSQGAKPGESARTDAQPEISDLSPEDLDALKEDFPTVYKGLVAMQAQAAALTKQLATVNASVQETEAQAQRTVAETVQDTIDAIPKMAHIQATDEGAFKLAQQFDATLRAQPAWKDKPLSERFAKVTEMVEAALGPITLPGAKPDAADGKVVDLKAAAKAKAEAAGGSGKGAVPTSLSEFPAGQAAASSENEAVANMTTLQLAEKFAAMNDAQMDAYLQQLN